MARKSIPSSGLSRGTDAWLRVVQAYHLCDKVLAARLAALDVSVPEHEVLMNLLRHPGATQQQIAKGCFVAKSGVSMLLSRLEALELIRREADVTDARLKRAFLTAKGEKLAGKAHQIQLDLVALMVEPLNESQLATVAEAMLRVSERLQKVS